jgi:hypothetical protein
VVPRRFLDGGRIHLVREYAAKEAVRAAAGIGVVAVVTMKLTGCHRPFHSKQVWRS